VKIKEVKDLSPDEMKQKNRELVEELFRLQIRHASGQLESPAMMKNIRRDIARIKTLLREREGKKI
jgi:large subunit ribosomal protein L29